MNPALPQLLDAARLAAVRRTGLLDTGAEQSFDRLGELARRLTGSPFALVSLVDEDRQFFKSCLGVPAEVEAARGTPLSHSICQYALTSPDPLVIGDTLSDARVATNGAVTDLGVRAYLGVPLVDAQGHVLGSFCVLDTATREWSPEDVATMTELAASVMSEIALREALIERDRVSAVLASSEARLRSTLDGLFIFVGTLDSEGRIVDANTATLEAAMLEDRDLLGLPFWETPFWAHDASEQRRVRADVFGALEGASTRRDATIRVGTASVITIDFQLVPLRDHQGHVVGVVSSALDISGRVAFEAALERLAKRESAQRSKLERIFSLSSALTAAVSLDDVVTAVATYSADVVGADFANVARSVDGEIELRHGPGLEVGIGERWPRVPRDDSSPLGHAIIHGQMTLLGSPVEIAERFPSGADDAKAAGFHAIGAVPIPRSAAAIGYAWKSVITPDEELGRLLRVTAELVGDALERATLYERERSVAVLLQRAMLPARLEPIGRYAFSGYYAAGTDGLHVGGDWYNVTETPGGKTFAAIGDVVGHGLESAVTMASLRTAFSALAQTANGVDELINRLDQFALSIAGARMSSVAVAELHADGEVEIILAGHVPPLHRRSDGTVVQLPDAGPPLGLGHAVPRTVHRIRLVRGECIVLYTDGLVETRTDSIDVGLKRLVETLGESTSEFSTIGEQLYRAMGSPHQDDVAVLVVASTL